jgi:hypothetical protein
MQFFSKTFFRLKKKFRIFFSKKYKDVGNVVKSRNLEEHALIVHKRETLDSEKIKVFEKLDADCDLCVVDEKQTC